MCLKCVEKKKLLGRHNKVAKWLFNYRKIQKEPPEVFYKKTVLLKTSQYSQDDQKITYVGNHLFLIENIAKFLRAPILKNIYERLLLKMCS